MFPLPPGIEHLVAAHSGSILLETARPDSENRLSYLFRDPASILIPATLDDIPDLFDEIEILLSQGYFIAGAMTYECGYHFEPRAALRASATTVPLAWFGAYKRPWIFNHETGRCDRELSQDVAPPSSGSDPLADNIQACGLLLDRDSYCAKIDAIRNYIAAGDTYQVNFTTRVQFEYPSSSAVLYAGLRAKQKVPYAAFMNLGDRQILSLSPELFFRLAGRTVTARPMKGTASRGVNVDDDRRIAEWLRNDPKNQSENVMIVDLLRNDLGRVAEPGSVRVERLFDVQRYETLFQMTSTVCATLRHNTSFYDLFRAIFPCGSVTGAPKLRTMQIIQELESAPRGIYTGAIGYISPDRDAVFSVPIRTIVAESGRGEMGVGSGIVYDAVAAEEYEECRLKTQFLTRREPEFELIETLRWDGQYCLLRKHLERLRSSAEYFGFPFCESEIVAALTRHAATLPSEEVHKVRLLLGADGGFSITSEPLATGYTQGTAFLSSVSTSSRDRFLYHKTTHRVLYDTAYRDATLAGYMDVLFTNERGEITEGAIHNVFLGQGSRLYTPPLSCGLLPGIFRAHVLATNPHASEKLLRIEDLLAADSIYLCNSVRGMRRVRLEIA